MPTAQAIKCGCGKSLSIPPTFKAAKAKCPGCGAVLTVNAPASASKVVQTIAGYGVLSTLESGPRGEVLRARDPKGKPVRLVGPPPAVAQNPDFIARFRQEAGTAKSVAHAHLLKVQDVLDAAGKTYVVTDDVEGESLATIFARGEPMDVARASELFVQILAAVATAHNAKLIHRDLRPEHVWIGSDGKARVAGFGVAKPTARELKGQPLDAQELPHYLAPEIIKGDAVTSRVDLYSIGCMFYQALTGQTPYNETTVARLRMMQTGTSEPTAVRQIRNEVSVPLSRLVARLMSKDAQQRYMKADVALRDLAAQAGVAPPPVAGPAAAPKIERASSGDDEEYEEEEIEEERSEGGIPLWAKGAIALFVVGVLVAAYYAVQSLSVPKVPEDPNSGANPANPNGQNPPVVTVKDPTKNGDPPIVIEDPMEVRKRTLRRDLETYFARAGEFAEATSYIPAAADYKMIAQRIQDDGLAADFAKEQTIARTLQQVCLILIDAMKALDEGRFDDAKGVLDRAKAELGKGGDPATTAAWTPRITRHFDQLKEAPLAKAQERLFHYWSSDERVSAEEMLGYYSTLEAAPDSKYTKETWAAGKDMFETSVKQIRGFIENLQVPEAERAWRKLRTSFGRAPWGEPEVSNLRKEIDDAKKDMPPENP